MLKNWVFLLWFISSIEKNSCLCCCVRTWGVCCGRGSCGSPLPTSVPVARCRLTGTFGAVEALSVSSRRPSLDEKLHLDEYTIQTGECWSTIQVLWPSGNALGRGKCSRLRSSAGARHIWRASCQTLINAATRVSVPNFNYPSYFKFFYD